jgi:RecB family exonuclease
MTLVEDVYLFSNSEITTFQGCPRKWWLAWFRGLTPRAKNVQGPMSTGTRIHIALAGYYSVIGSIDAEIFAKASLNTAQVAAMESLEAQYEFDEELNMRAAKLQSDFDLERIMLEGYLEWIQETGLDATLEVVGVEQYLEVDFPMHLPHDPQKVKLIGKIDSRVRSRVTGRRLFIDHKTVQSVHDVTLNMNRQMLHYHLLEQLTTAPDEPRCDGALYNMLRKVKRTRASKPPYYARVPIDHNHRQIASYSSQIYGIIARIIEAHAYFRNRPANGVEQMQHQVAAPARPSRECSWCPFLKVCTMFDDGSRVEAALEDLYEIKDPLSYYGAREKEGEHEQAQ